MSEFEMVAIKYFKSLEGMFQRIDGIACFSPLPRFWFWRIRLDRLVKKGKVRRMTTSHSIFPSMNGMPFYGGIS